MNYIEESFKIIDLNLNQAFFSQSNSDEKISKAEELLGLKFPNSYKIFLKKYGSGGIYSVEIYGMTKSLYDDGLPNILWIVNDEREKYNLPHEYIIIGDSGFGPWYVIDTSVKNNEGENPVLMYGGGYATEKIADSFGEFLYNELKTAMENEEEDDIDWKL